MSSNGPPGAPAPVRGLVVIGVAVLVGLFLLSQGFDDSLPTAINTTDSGDAAETSDTTAPPVTETSTAAGRDPATVPVYVANGSGISGEAGRITDELRNAGYAGALEPGNATATDITQVFFVSGWDAEAQAVATTLGLGADRAVAWPEPPPFGEVPAEATVIVQVGTDLAQAAG